METSTRYLCGECLRSFEAEPADAPGRDRRRPADCSYCGRPLEAAPTAAWEPTAEYTTPISLELSPDLCLSWSDPPGPTLGASDRVGRFQLREHLGGGGFGQVYRAYDPRLDREVALKVLRDVRPTARVMERFFREARAAAQLDHPHIIALHDAGRDLGRCWIAYQYVKGARSPA